MIREVYVSFETAKLLKEKGFNEVTSKWYLKYKGEYTLVSRGTAEHPDSSIDVPTLQMAMKWLREEKKLYVNVWAEPRDFENNDFSTIYRMHVYNGTSNNGTREFYKYEDACEAGIRYCLENLI